MALRQKSRTSPVLVVGLSLLCFALIAVGIVLFWKGTGGAGNHSINRIFQVEGLDPTAQTGALPGSPRDEKSPGENLFSYRINATPTFKEDCTNGNILVENPQFNEYLMVLELALEDDGKLIYQSQYIAPNQYIEKIDLQTQLLSGDYQAVAYLNAIDPETLDLVGTLESLVTITIK